MLNILLIFLHYFVTNTAAFSVNRSKSIKLAGLFMTEYFSKNKECLTFDEYFIVGKGGCVKISE